MQGEIDGGFTMGVFQKLRFKSQKGYRGILFIVFISHLPGIQEVS